MKTLISLILILLVSFPSPSIANPFRSLSRCHPQDKKALLSIKTAFGNPDYLASWDPKTDCCEYWYKNIQCDPKTNRVTGLTIFNADLSGQIPSAVADLPYLEIININQLPNLFGTIPQFLTNLTRLKHLTLSSTSISGPIPDFLGQIKTLTNLHLSSNNLNGSIPPSLANLPKLNELNLNRNKLTGSIPDSFGKFKGKQPPTLYLSHNRLTGNVPKSLGYLKFPNLDFSHNKLQGDISFLFGPDKIFWTGDFARNKFHFDLSKVSFHRDVGSLDFNHNQIYGKLPKSMIKLTNLKYLDLSYNQLCGKIPVGGVLQDFKTKAYFRNQCLCGAPLSPCK